MDKIYVAVGAMIEKNNNFLVMKRSAQKDFGANEWEIITGRLNAEENPVEGVIREAFEESSLKIKVIMPISTIFFYRGSKDFPMILIVFWCKYISGKIKMNWEHSEYMWITIDEGINNPNFKIFKKDFEKVKQLKKYLPHDFTLE